MERTTRSLAKELAAVFYEESKRSDKFRAAFPTLQAYMRGQWHQPDGSIKLYRPGWLHFVDHARRMLVAMLGQPGVHDNIKSAVYDAILEDRDNQFKAGSFARKLHQTSPNRLGDA